MQSMVKRRWEIFNVMEEEGDREEGLEREAWSTEITKQNVQRWDFVFFFSGQREKIGQWRMTKFKEMGLIVKKVRRS